MLTCDAHSFQCLVPSHLGLACALVIDIRTLHSEHPQVLPRFDLMHFVRFESIIGWLVVLRINVALKIFQPYRDLEAVDNQSLNWGIEPRVR